jgi:hypothetical protein
MVKGGNPQDVSPRRHRLEKGIEGPDDARAGRKNENHGEHEQENHQWQQPPFLLSRAEPEKLSENAPHGCGYDNGEAEFGRVLISPRAKDGVHRGFLPAGNQAVFNSKRLSKSRNRYPRATKKEAEVKTSASLIYISITGFRLTGYST